MKTNYDYLEESTNIVKSNTNRNKIITIFSCLLVLAGLYPLSLGL